MGKAADGHQIRTSGTTATLSITDTPGNALFITTNGGTFDWRSSQNNNLWQGVDGVNNPCPSGFRLPTITELDAERAIWGTQNAAGAFASSLKLTKAGSRIYDGSLNSYGSAANYWSSTVNGTNSFFLQFDIGVVNCYSDFRADGFSVRCIKN